MMRRNPERDAEIGRLYSEGLNQREIAARVGLGQSAISRALDRLGIERDRDRPARDAEILRLWRLGLSRSELSERVDMSLSGVHFALKRLGAPRRRLTRGTSASDARDVAIRALWHDESIALDAAGRALGVSASTLREVAQRLGLPPRKRGRKARA